MFVDKVQITVQAGNGGNGAVSFRHEKFVDRGGPDGGDGGKGGDVVFVAEHNESSLAKFRFNPRIIAKSGVNGAKQKKRGAKGEDIIVTVPVGTVVSVNDRVVADFTLESQEEVIAQGGKGGFGNAHFISSTRQVPKVAELGEKGEEFELVLELKMLADVGLVGLPNAGKSTFLSVITNAKPEIADYPFTTLVPNLGVADIDNTSLLVADIPGLIEGASEGKGLGDEFLRHIERTAVLVHLVDGTANEVAEEYQTITQELKDYSLAVAKKPRIVILSKTDLLDDELIAMQLAALKAVVPARTKLLSMSAKQPESVKAVLRQVAKMVQKHRQRIVKKGAGESTLPVYELTDEKAWKVFKTNDGFEVIGKTIERFAARTDFTNPAGVARLRDIMRKTGVMHELDRKGASAKDIIHIGESSLEY